jgi:hypothetical protein
MIDQETRNLLWLCFVGFFIFTSCDDQFLGMAIPDLPLSQLQSAPEQVEIGSQSFTLDATVWRDLMPGDRPMSSRLLNVSINVIESNEQTVTALIGLGCIWVVQGDSVWASRFSNEDQPPVPAHMIHGIARGGPEWKCETLVDVIVGLDDQTGEIKLLRSVGHPIECPQ